MSDEAFDAAVLEGDLRRKVIYYSCFNPHTIADINAAWGYSSPTYLYQNSALEALKDADMITVDTVEGKNVITTNYKGLFSAENVAASREHVNREILREFLIHAKGFHPRAHHSDDHTDLLDMGRGNLEDGLEGRLAAIEFDPDEYATLTRLWQDDVFREAFLSIDTVSRLFGPKKDELPANPLIFLFKLTSGIAVAVGRARDERRMEVPAGLTYRAEKVIVPVYRRLKTSSGGATFDGFTEAMNDVYSLYRSKFQDDRFNYAFVNDFADLAMQTRGERKFGKLFERYRDAF